MRRRVNRIRGSSRPSQAGTSHSSGPKFSNAGKATLYCDGVSYGLVDEYSSTTIAGQVVAWCHFATSGQHTMKLAVQGTSGRPWFGVDAFTTLG